MLFDKILVSVDGSVCSQLAVDYALWLAGDLGASVSAQHVMDPRLLALIIAPEFAENLGFGASINAAEKVTAALKMIGNTVLDLVKKEAHGLVDVQTFLDYGLIVEKIVERAQAHDLAIVGHHGREATKTLTDTMIGSVAERVVLLSKKPVLVATHPARDIEEIAVAFDGSEASRGALLLGEALATRTKKKLKAMVVAQSESTAHLADAQLTVEQGTRLLDKSEAELTFSIVAGPTTATILNWVKATGDLLIIGAYGYRTPEENVLGSTTTGVIRRAKTSVLIYR
jgi:nucleotide-binding universal stress UspA family protein